MDFALLYENDTGEFVVLNDVRIADIRLASLVYLLVYVSTYCEPVAHLRQNKPFPLLYLGHAQIKSFTQRVFLAKKVKNISEMEWNSFVCFTVDKENSREPAKQQRKGINRTRRKLLLRFLSEKVIG